MYVPTQAHRIFVVSVGCLCHCSEVQGGHGMPCDLWPLPSKLQHMEGVVVYRCATAVADEALLCVFGALQSLSVRERGCARLCV